ncbi:amp-dependent synthetase/ligase in alkane synthesis cluster [hydrocarbon metagenome]|uniref:Amp-dependent synthetase/ligase in alkane synthesis cluster n=1 Tax=hydrocarbon metagenome TaxID=938273 RepID=A0A0W8FNE5_9ZZZZ
MNIADRFTQIARTHQQKIAVKFPRRAGNKYNYDVITFGELESLVDKYANGLSQIGFSRGSKTLLFVRPSLQFPALVFALFKLGVIPVLIDPGMGRKNLLAAIEEVAPEGLIAEPEVHFLSLLFGKSFKSVKFKVSTKWPQIGNCVPLVHLESCDATFVSEQLEPDEMAAILFTSGGTGRPKGVVYTHKIYTEQTRLLQELFDLSDNEIDLPCFPLFSLFTLCMGMTSCIPDMDPSKPATANPKKLLQNITDNKVTFMAGSPAIWERLGDYCAENKITLPSVKYLVMFGAPVRNELHEKFKQVLPNGTTYTPYGATECLPVSKISGKIILDQTAALTEKGNGTCVGTPVPGVEVTIIDISDDIIENIKNARLLGPYQIGEIIVKGDIVTANYYQFPLETALAKIADDESFWHRIGDLGYIDDHGRIWFCGRKTHRVETPLGLLCSVNCEAIFNAHSGVSRSALVGLGEKGKQSAAIVIERNELGKKYGRKVLEKELLNMAKNNSLTAQIKSVHFCDHFPVDVRHNIKIDRLKLANYVLRRKI